METRTGARALLVSLTALALAIGLSACGGGPAPAPSGSITPTATALGPEPSATPTPDPTLRPDGSALQNLEYFTWVLERAVDDGARKGADFIKALDRAGFDKKRMEVTPDRTAINLDADSVQFSVKINGTCLLGQYGNVGLATAAMPVLETGRCIIGSDRPA